MKNLTTETPEISIYEQLRAAAKAAGTTLSAVCRAQGISPGAIQKWKYKDPTAITTYNKLCYAIANAKVERKPGLDGE